MHSKRLGTSPPSAHGQAADQVEELQAEASVSLASVV